jgi:putative ABC transport system permease protein
MRFIRGLEFRLRCLLRRTEVDEELSDELQDYVERQTQHYLDRGLSPADARTAALRDVGGVEPVKEACRDVRGTAFVESFARDLRYGFRILRKNRGFFATTSITLALGIGTATTLFSVVESQLWRPLPFRDSNRLAVLWERNLKQKWEQAAVSAPTFADWRQRNHAFESMAAMQFPVRRNFAGGGFMERPRVAAVSAGFFETLQVELQAGHTFRPEDEQPGKQTKAILSAGLARRAFGSPAAAIGKTIKLDDEPFLVTGILPDRFRLDVLSSTSDVYVPLEISFAKSRDLRELVVIGRMRAGVTLNRARADMEAVARGIASEHPETNANFSVLVWPPRELFPSSTRTLLLLSFGFSVFVLLIACANVAGLQLMRSVMRQRELAVREALGASRWTLVRQAMAESAWIASTGAVLGMFLAVLSMDVLRSLPLEDLLLRERELSLDAWSVVFAVVVSAFATFLFGLAPGSFASKLSLEGALRDSGRSVSSGKGSRRKIELLAATEVILAFISLFGAGLFVVSNWNLQHVPLGFEPHNVLAVQVALGGSKYSDQMQVRQFYRHVAQEMSITPGVQEFALVSRIPLMGAAGAAFARTDRSRPLHGQEPTAMTRVITPEYFHVLEIPIIRGRGFTEGDAEMSSRVAVINQNFARHHFPGENPIGKELLVWSRGGSDIADATVQIVGVAGNIKDTGLDEIPFNDLYLPFAQNPLRGMYVVVKTNASSSVMPVLRRKFSHLGEEQFIGSPKPLESYVDDGMQSPRFNLSLIAIFAGLALTLTAVALYGTVSFAVAQQTREIGIRIALGAQPGGVLRFTIQHVLALTIAGSACGFAIAFALGAIFRNDLYLVPYQHSGILYGVGIHDPLSFACSAILVLSCAGLAGLIPGIRATRIDPCATLRCE